MTIKHLTTRFEFDVNGRKISVIFGGSKSGTCAYLYEDGKSIAGSQYFETFSHTEAAAINEIKRHIKSTNESN